MNESSSGMLAFFVILLLLIVWWSGPRYSTQDVNRVCAAHKGVKDIKPPDMFNAAFQLINQNGDVVVPVICVDGYTGEVK